MDTEDFRVASSVATFYEIDDVSLKNMVISVVRDTKWPPDVIGGLFIDGIDYMGLEYWYDDVKQVSEEMEEKFSKKKKKNRS